MLIEGGYFNFLITGNVVMLNIDKTIFICNNKLYICFYSKRRELAMVNEITFIVKGLDNKSSLGRCLKSIYRQSNKSFRVVVITSLEKKDVAFLSGNEKTEFVFIKDKAKFLETSNNLIKQLDSQYFMYINSDSVLPADAVEKILSRNEDTIICNISKPDKNHKFKAVYPKGKNFTLSNYIKCGVSVWNNAICTQHVKNEGLFLYDWSYFSQLMYLLRLYSTVGTIGIVFDVLVYRATLIKKKKITYVQFSENRRLLTKILKGFTAKNMIAVKKQLLNDFVFSNIDEYYDEKRFIFKLIKKHRFRKYICI